MPRGPVSKTLTASAQWSANGSGLGAADLTLADNQVGANVFSPAVQRQRLPKHATSRCS